MRIRVTAVLRRARAVAAVVLLAVSVLVVIRVADAGSLAALARRLLADPVGLLAALVAYALAFGLRAWAWCRVQPALPAAQAWAAVHVGLLGNHVLPLRLGEALRPLSAARRGGVGLAEAGAATLALRSIDLLTVLLLAALAAPALLLGAAGTVWPAAGVLLVGLVAGLLLARSRSRHDRDLQGRSDRVTGSRLPWRSRSWAGIGAAALLAWALESAVVLQVAAAAGVTLSPLEAIGVTAVTVAAQALALTPGGIGTYEAAGTAALVAAGTDPGTAFAVALGTHAVKTGYALLAGGLALAVPAPTFLGRLRLPRGRPPRPPALPQPDGAPVVVLVPVHDEAAAIAGVLRRVPPTCAGRPVRVLVVDDGSGDGSGDLAAAAGARVVRHPVNLGLGAAVRRGLAEACRLRPAAVVYLDGDGEYAPEDIAAVSAPVLAGRADYVVGSRFAGRIERMLPQRRFGNRVLTWWLRQVARERSITDGQSGFRSFSPAAAADAEIVHDYNYAQVLTLDLLAKGYVYAEVPIRYAFRESGTSFVTLGAYLRRVLPAVHAELAGAGPAQSSTTWRANLLRAADHAVASSEPSGRSAATAS